MSNFQDPYSSHDHSMKILNQIYEYDDFMDSIEVIADMGCGSGLDIMWWATATTRDEERPEPHDYTCYAVDIDLSHLMIDEKPDNLTLLEVDFELDPMPRKVDVIWCHDSFQFVKRPLDTLRLWNKNLNLNGMLVMSIYQNMHTKNGRYRNISKSYNYYNYTVPSLIYMLAVNGFDCKDAYFQKAEGDPWINLVVYKSSVEPMDPAKTSWYDLADAGLLHNTVLNSINKYGYVDQADLGFSWLNRSWRHIKD